MLDRPAGPSVPVCTRGDLFSSPDSFSWPINESLAISDGPGPGGGGMQLGYCKIRGGWKETVGWQDPLRCGGGGPLRLK